MYFDSHTHTIYSGDSPAEPEEMVKSAIEKGFLGISITDHYDVNRDAPRFRTRRVKTVEVIDSLKEKYKGKLILTEGMEIAQQNFSAKINGEITGAFTGDFVLGSLHRSRGEADFSELDFSKFDFLYMLDGYYEELLETAQIGDLDILAHITYPLRYAPKELLADLDMGRYDELITETMRTLITQGKGIELNMSGQRQPYGKPFPTPEYIALYRSLGGEVITLGSDAHLPQDVGALFQEGAEILRAAGFTHYNYFVNRKPVYLDL